MAFKEAENVVTGDVLKISTTCAHCGHTITEQHEAANDAFFDEAVGQYRVIDTVGRTLFLLGSVELV